MINEEVAAPVFIAKIVAVRIPTILLKVEVVAPVVLAYEVLHKVDSF